MGVITVLYSDILPMHWIRMQDGINLPEDKKFCECGCGEIINKFGRGPSEVRKYKQYHRSRLPKGHYKPVIPPKTCACGCKGIIPSPKVPSLERRYIDGHAWGWKKHNALGFKISDEGYILIYQPNYPYGKKSGWVKEHRLVWETYNNAILCKWTDIHHINGIKTDNRIENLQPLIHGKHTALHKKKESVIN